MPEIIKPVVPALPVLAIEERKKILIAQGALLRNNIDASIGIVRANLRAERLARNAVNKLTTAAYNAVEGFFDWNTLRNGDIKKLLPLAMSAYSIITRRKLLAPILCGTAVVAAISASTFFLWRYKQRVRAAKAVGAEEPASQS